MTDQRTQRQVRARHGQWAERFSALYLRACGYKIVRRNWQNPGGEVDLIATKKDIIVFVEVKYRKQTTAPVQTSSGGIGYDSGKAALRDGLEAVHHQKQERIANGARHFLMRFPAYATLQTRFDVIVLVSGRLWVFPRIFHLRDAFMTVRERF